SRVVALTLVRARVAHDDRDPVEPGGEISERPIACREKIFPQQQVLGWIAAERKLGRHDEVGTGTLRAVAEFLDAIDVSCEIADRGVQLRNRNFHFSNISSRDAATPSRATVPQYGTTPRW